MSLTFAQQSRYYFVVTNYSHFAENVVLECCTNPKALGAPTSYLIIYAVIMFANCCIVFVAYCKGYEGRVGKSLTAKASHRTVRETLASYGSYHTNHFPKRIASDKTLLDS
jgi:hypothetical protein